MAGRGGKGELVAGGVAAASLPLLVYGLDVSPWLAIPLAIATYAGGLLLRPRPRPPQPDGAASEPGPPDAARAHGLSPRELDVLRLMAWGRSNQEIAVDLSISLRTVTTHVTNIFNKLGVASRAEAIAYAHRHGLAGPDPSRKPRPDPRLP
jgi:DNA-binding CsgD family transcriptional regulator